MSRDAKSRFYTVEKLGPNQEKTPEGFLLCRNVPIARTGVQLYGPGESPVEVGPDGIAWVSRDAKDVFHPDTIASFHGKPVVNDHPMEDVTPETWALLAKGTVLDPRRGEGIEDHLLIADLLITDQEMIDLILAGKVEVSCGYDAEYEETEIVGNHVAVVEAGRCGPQCAVRDHARKGFGGNTVAKTKTLTFDSVRKSLKAGIIRRYRDSRVSTGDPVKDAENEKELEKALDAELEKVEDAAEGEGGDVHVHLGGTEDAAAFDAKFEAYDAKFAAFDKRVKDLEEKEEARDKKHRDEDVTDAEEEELEKETGTKDARKARDSAHFVDSFQEVIATAEIIAPGIKKPTLDAALSPKKTLDQICQFRRKALGIAAMTPAGAVIVAEHAGSKVFTADSITGLSCGEVRNLFNGVGATMRLVNDAAKHSEANRGTNDGKTKVLDLNAPATTPAEFNAKAAAFWAKESN